MRELLPGVLTWPWFSEPHGYDFNGTLVLHKDGNLCIDPLEPDAAVLEHLTKEGIAQILITNRNHVRAANAIRRATGARVAIHSADAARAREQGAEIDAGLGIGERVGPFRVVGVPGKSPGEVALHDPVNRYLVVGDAVVGNPPGALSLLSERVIDDPARLRESVRRLLELSFDAVIVGDGIPLLKEGRQRLEELVAGFPPA